MVTRRSGQTMAEFTVVLVVFTLLGLVVMNRFWGKSPSAQSADGAIPTMHNRTVETIRTVDD